MRIFRATRAALHNLYLSAVGKKLKSNRHAQMDFRDGIMPKLNQEDTKKMKMVMETMSQGMKEEPMAQEFSMRSFHFQKTHIK